VLVRIVNSMTTPALSLADANIESEVRKAFRMAGSEPPSGSVATYIPELARVSPDLMALSICDATGQIYSAGDDTVPFTIQSVSKVFSLALALEHRGRAVYDVVGYEPTGNPFFSMLPLESERGKPRNPFVNTGAIAVSSMIAGADAASKYAAFLKFLSNICDGESFAMDDATYRSESATGYRNRAMANFLKQYGWIDDVDTAVESYFMHCSTLANVKQLARLGLFLAFRGKDPVTGAQVMDEESCRSIVTLMTTCGTYDYAGRVAIEIGVPCKSGVSGAMLAIVPGRFSIAAFSPRLAEHGNSVSGMRMLQILSESMELSLFQ
jgi:glutaminase